MVMQAPCCSNVESICAVLDSLGPQNVAQAYKRAKFEMKKIFPVMASSALLFVACTNRMANTEKHWTTQELYDYYYSPHDEHEAILTWREASPNTQGEKRVYIFQGKEMGLGREGIQNAATEASKLSGIRKIKIVAYINMPSGQNFLPAEDDPVNVAHEVERILVPLADKMQIELDKVFPFGGDTAVERRLPNANE